MNFGPAGRQYDALSDVTGRKETDMKVKDFVKKYALARSGKNTAVTVHVYHKDSNGTELFELTNHDIVHMGEKNGPLPEIADATLESFELRTENPYPGKLLAELRINCSI